ncbi:MAG: Bax inhibitor-1/YccA family protein [Gemmatimonadaceae bacterium]
MARFNPTLKESVFKSAYVSAGAERMTLQGTVIKSFLLIALTIFSATWVWANVATKPFIVGPAILVGALGGLVVALITTFRPQSAPITAPIYAVLEGLALGAISAIYQARFKGLPFEAIGLTFMVALGMLVAYQTGLLRATETFKRVVISATVGIMFFYLFAMVVRLFGVPMPFLHDSSPLGIGISLVITGVAALNLILDFDLIEQGAKNGAAKYMEWYGGFSLLVTLVWLYLEILRLLSRLQRR